MNTLTIVAPLHLPASYKTTVPVTSKMIETRAATRIIATTTRSTALLRYGSPRSYFPLMYIRMPGAYRSDMSVSPTAPDAQARKKL